MIAATPAGGSAAVGRRLIAAALLGATLLAVLAAILGAAPARAEDDGNLTVEIVDPSSSPSPPPTAAPTPPPAVLVAPTPPGTVFPAPFVSSETIAEPTAADAALGDGTDTLAGLIYVSKAETAPSHTLHPNGGDVRIVLSIRNVSGQIVDGVARFRLTTAWGWKMSDVLEVPVEALQMGETRRLTATLPGPGQWVLYRSHAEFVPPDTVDGVEMRTIERAENFVVVPWFSIAIAVGLGLLAVGYAWWRRARAREAVAE